MYYNTRVISQKIIAPMFTARQDKTQVLTAKHSLWLCNYLFAVLNDLANNLLHPRPRRQMDWGCWLLPLIFFPFNCSCAIRNYIKPFQNEEAANNVRKIFHYKSSSVVESKLIKNKDEDFLSS